MGRDSIMKVLRLNCPHLERLKKRVLRNINLAKLPHFLCLLLFKKLFFKVMSPP